MTCPKCHSASIFDAMGEAPIGVTAWKKCMACGKRWEPTKPAAQTSEMLETIRQAIQEAAAEDQAEAVELGEDAGEPGADLETAFDEDEELEPIEQVESPTDLAMKDVRAKRAKGDSMGRAWTPERRARFMATMAANRPAASGHVPEKKRPGRPRKYANAAHRKAVEEAAERAKSLEGAGVPAVREPKTVLPRAVAGNTLSVIDAAIVQIREDVDALVRAREILARMQG